MVHKYALGAFVLHRTGARSEKASFRVTRQLPDGGVGLQYRIKGERDGIERVVSESELERGVLRSIFSSLALVERNEP
jgi:hypothetical protein